jgi:hypothetical protein
MVRNAGLCGLRLLAVACATSFAACGGLSIERVGNEPAESGGAATPGDGGTAGGGGSAGASGASTAASTGGTGGSSAEEFGGAGNEPAVACEKHRAASVCILGMTMGLDQVVAPGDAFYVGVRPVGCYSDNCTAWAQEACRLDESSGDYFASVGFCSYSITPTFPPCDETCWVETTFCTSSVRLTRGHHVLWYGTQHVDFDVPSVFPEGSLCTQ